MRSCLFLLFCLLATQLPAQQEPDKAFIFDPSITQNYHESFNAILGVMASYYEGVEYSNEKKLQAAFHSSWHMRDNDGTQNTFIHIEDKPTFIKRVKDHGNYKDYASQRKIGALEVIHDQLAFVRIDKSPSKNVTLFFLAKIDGAWKIIDKLWVYPEDNYNPLFSNELLTCLQSFYDGHTPENDFDSKVLSNTSFEITQTSKLKDHEIKLVSVLSVYDRMAVVRTDYPAINTTAYIVLFRLDSGWKVAGERISKKK